MRVQCKEWMKNDKIITSLQWQSFIMGITLKSANTWITCNIGNSIKNSVGFFLFPLMHLISVFLYNTPFLLFLFIFLSYSFLYTLLSFFLSELPVYFQFHITLLLKSLFISIRHLNFIQPHLMSLFTTVVYPCIHAMHPIACWHNELFQSN